MARGSSVRLGVLALLWGSNFLLIRVALEGLSPLEIVAARMLLGAAVLLAVVRARGQRLATGRRVWGHLAVTAIIANIVPYFLFAWAEQTVPSHVAGALSATTPLFTSAIAIGVGQERVTARRVVGLLLGFVGAVTVLSPWRQGGLAGCMVGQVACLAAAASYGLSYGYMRRHLTGRGLAPLVLAAGQLTAAAVMLVPFTPLLAAGALHLSPAVAASVVALGTLGTGAAYILNYRLIQDEGATTASTVTYLLPVVAVVLGGLLLGEPVTWSLLTGGVTVLLGVAVTQGRLSLPRRGRPPAARRRDARRRSGRYSQPWRCPTGCSYTITLAGQRSNTRAASWGVQASGPAPPRSAAIKTRRCSAADDPCIR
jgi:drug/metabolite transporter (DMT)-like permease